MFSPSETVSCTLGDGVDLQEVRMCCYISNFIAKTLGDGGNDAK